MSLVRLFHFSLAAYFNVTPSFFAFTFSGGGGEEELFFDDDKNPISGCANNA